jgi:hypothetical protein
VLAPVKGKSLRDGLRPPLTATARSVRRKIRSGRGDNPRQSNKEMTGHYGLDTNRPIQVLGVILTFKDDAVDDGNAEIPVTPDGLANGSIRPERPFADCVGSCLPLS